MVALEVLGEQLDLMVSEGFSNPDNSMIASLLSPTCLMSTFFSFCLFSEAEEDEEETEKLQNGKDRGEGTKLSQSSAAFSDSLLCGITGSLWSPTRGSGCRWMPLDQGWL